jgi:hypothetical protein
VAAIVATLRHVVRYSNSDDSGKASHSSNFGKKMLDEEKFRETSHLPLVVSHRSVRHPTNGSAVTVYASPILPTRREHIDTNRPGNAVFIVVVVPARLC